MTALLYYSFSKKLSENELIKVNKQVLTDKESVYHFLIKLPSNSKRRAKRIWLYLELIVVLNQSLSPACAVMLPPPAVYRLSAIQQDEILSNEKSYSKITEILHEKVERIRVTNKQFNTFNTLALQLNNNLITVEEAILQLRGGDGLSEVAGIFAFIIFINWYDSIFGVKALARNAYPLPHQDPVGWMTGKYDKKPDITYRSSRFQLEMAGVSNNMCPGLGLADENGFVMSYEDAYDLVAKTYPGYLQVNESCRITDWQAAKHIYHAHGIGIDPKDYGFSQKKLERLRGESRYKGGGGLIAYARRGYKLPSIELIRAYQMELKTKTNEAPIKRTNVPYYDKNGAWGAKVFASPSSENDSGIVIAYNESTGDLITGDQQRPKSFTRFIEENYLGSPTWMSKWKNK